MQKKRITQATVLDPGPLTPEEEAAFIAASKECAKRRGIVQKPWPVKKPVKRTA